MRIVEVIVNSESFKITAVWIPLTLTASAVLLIASACLIVLLVSNLLRGWDDIPEQVAISSCDSASCCSLHIGHFACFSILLPLAVHHLEMHIVHSLLEVIHLCVDLFHLGVVSKLSVLGKLNV